MRLNQVFLVPAVFIRRLLRIIVGILLVWLAYRWALHTTLRREHVVTGVLVLYLLTAYIILPRFHKLVTKFYVPQFFDGRTRTGDGLLSDPINIALKGSAKQLERAMLSGGWVVSDPVNFRSIRKVIYGVIFNKSYPQTPAGTQFLFGRKQDYPFQKEIGKSARRRHHMRVWRVPDGWRLPDGTRIDWFGSAHRDVSIRLSYFTWQFMHIISPDLNMERDFMAKYLRNSGHAGRVSTYKQFTSAYRHYTGDGFTFHTDGNLTIIDLK